MRKVGYLIVWLTHELTYNIEIIDAEEEKFIDYPCEIEDYICDKVLNANGNLSINFFCLILKRFIDSQLESKIDSIKCYDFLEYYSAYLEASNITKKEFTRNDYDAYEEYFAFLDEDEEPTNEKMLQELANLQQDVCEMILGSITEGKQLIEELLIQLIGHENITVRSLAIKYLNCIYDGNIWKLELPTSTEVKVTKDK